MLYMHACVGLCVILLITVDLANILECFIGVKKTCLSNYESSFLLESNNCIEYTKHLQSSILI